MALLAISLGACSQNNKQKEVNKMERKTLVAFFSASGVTKGVAQKIAHATGGNLYQIQPSQPYTDADLDWTNKQSRSTLEMKDRSSRPSITGKVNDVAQYDIVYLGFPIWWYTAPTIVNTFIESNHLEGKTVVPFATSGGSSISKACQDLKKAYPNIKWREGSLLNNPSTADIEKFVK